MDIDSGIDSTNADGLISSSNNVTIEAIVFNKVPILDINLFEMNELACVSGTGNYFVYCETCYEKQQAELEAKKPPEEEKDAGKIYPKQKLIVPKQKQNRVQEKPTEMPIGTIAAEDDQKNSVQEDKKVTPMVGKIR